MADLDPRTPEERDPDAREAAARDEQDVQAEGHTPDEPTPAPDPHTRTEASDADVVRPDQQEEVGPIGGLMHASATEAVAEVTGDEDAHAEAERLGVEGEGVEAAQIFTIMATTALTLALAVIGVFLLVGVYADEETVERDAVALYPELREVERVYDEMQNYSRTDSLYRLPIQEAMSQVATAYGSAQGTAAVPAPDDFNTLYLDAVREASVDGGLPLESTGRVAEEGADATAPAFGEEAVASPETGTEAGTDAGAPVVSEEGEAGEVAPEDEPEDR